MQVLLAESDAAHAGTLQQSLRRHGYDVGIASNGVAALEAHREYDLMLLGLELIDIDGLEICRAVRASSEIPIIALTARDTELDRVLSLQAGCDDCLAKPYGFRELAARIEAVMRRSRRQPPSVHRIVRGPLSIDRESREVRLDGRSIAMTRKEFDLLHILASEPRAVLSRERLMSEVWKETRGTGAVGRQVSRTLDTHVNMVRQKLGDHEWIVTVRGVGFRFGHY
ncbi:response regulator transcription factor [Kitasatospora sp. NPDC094011]|uniref:response regulator transcription factor n=1 Tax=Kitasatospora sp. NPDC094011 TaxID=3364090 RepID=UPI00381DDC95